MVIRRACKVNPSMVLKSLSLILSSFLSLTPEITIEKLPF